MSVTEEQGRDLKRAQAYREMSGTTGWTMLGEFLEEHTQEALEAMRKLMPSTEESAMSLLIRWREREAFKNSILAHVDTYLDAQEQILNDLKEPSGESTDGNESDSTE